jgi:hypothetical protein
VLQTDELVPATSRKAAAEVRVAVAVASLREAQRLIEEAGQALQSINGMRSEWKRLDALHERVRRIFYDVRGKADTLALKDRLVLDHEPDSEEARWTSLWRGRL